MRQKIDNMEGMFVMTKIDFGKMLESRGNCQKELKQKFSESNECFETLKKEYADVLIVHKKEAEELNEIIKEFKNKWNADPQYVEYEKKFKKLNKEWKAESKRIQAKYRV